ncbi:MAG: hypothetical protein A2189_05395 [Paenibacillus sp. RIFOXYA1_FULL_44_5]|nr:MAG: hypothetical protein A2189_05395 [Paenibacillus sp. RIFOXYA1_FULL_44_5]
MSDFLLLAFDSTQQALRAEMMLEYMDIEIDLYPTPKQITAGCALCIQFSNLNLTDVQQLIRKENIEINGIYHQINEGYEKIQ